MLDTTGGTRGTDTNEAALLRETWSKATLDSLTSAEALHEWETKDKPDAVKVIYDRAAAEVSVLGKWHGKSFGKTFPVEADLAAALKEAKSFIAEQTQKRRMCSVSRRSRHAPLAATSMRCEEFVFKPATTGRAG